MFYAQFVLSKKGPLAKIWLAAHWEKKLSKAQIYETNVQDAVDEILKPKVKMALRTTGHLLLGIVRIYSRKAKYLLADCNEAFLKIKMAFRPGQVDLTDEARQVDTNAINLPEVFHDFDAALPDFNELDMQAHMQINQSRIDDITLKEDLFPESTDMPFGGDFGGDDFGENSLGFFNDDQEQIEEARERASGAFSQLGEASGVLEDSAAKAVQNGKDIDLGEHLGMPDPDDDFGDFGTDNMLDDVVFNENELAKGIDAMEAPGAEHDAAMETEDIARGPLAGIPMAPTMPGTLINESFALEPLDATAIAIAGMEKAGRPKRKRRLIIDEQKNISGDEMKANMADYKDTLQPLDLAPPTKKLMRLKETGNVERLFNNPGCAALRAPTLLKFYRSHLVLRARNVGMLTNDDVRRDLEMVDNVDDMAEPDGSVVSGFMDDRIDDFDDIGTGGMSPMGSPLGLEAIAEEELAPAAADDTVGSARDPFSGPEKKKERKSRADRTMEEDDGAAEGEDDHRWTKRTQNVLNSISAKLKSSNEEQIALSDLLTKGSTRKTAAQKFYTLLVLKKWQAIDVRQDEPFGEIYITAGPNIAAAAAVA